MVQPSRRRNDATPLGAFPSRKAAPGVRLRLHSENDEIEVARRVQTLLGKVQDHSAVVGIVGLGYVGLPFAVEKAKVGYHVVGIEQNAERAGRVNRGENYIPDVH